MALSNKEVSDWELLQDVLWHYCLISYCTSGCEIWKECWSACWYILAGRLIPVIKLWRKGTFLMPLFFFCFPTFMFTRYCRKAFVHNIEREIYSTNHMGWEVYINTLHWWLIFFSVSESILILNWKSCLLTIHASMVLFY